MFKELYNNIVAKFNFKYISYDAMYNDVSKSLNEDSTETFFIESLIHYASNKVFTHYNYSLFAGNLFIEQKHNNTSYDIRAIYTNLNKISLIGDYFLDIIFNNYKFIESIIDYNLDYKFDYFAVNSLFRTYLLPGELPQHMFIRVAIYAVKGNMDKLENVYKNMANGYYTHASPTLLNAGKPKNQMSSCFILNIQDSIDSITENLTEAAKISQSAGGIGISVHTIRPAGSYISSSGGYSNGLVKMLKVWDAMVSYVNQGGKRNGACAVYIEPWHMDIEAVICLKHKTGPEDIRARGLFYALWVNDLFMERVKNKEKWTLFDASHFPGLDEAYGEEFNKLYTKYEQDILDETKYSNKIIFKNKPFKVIEATYLWNLIMQTLLETGGPYILFKDACNKKSNQQNIGTIKGGNLCAEVIEYSSSNEIAVCNLASIALPKFVEDKKFNFELFGKMVEEIVENLNNILNNNYYTSDKSKLSNITHRPIGLGVQGYADMLLKMRIPYDSEEANKLNKLVFETMYYHALKKSNELAKLYYPYSSFYDSPAAKGLLQFDLWDKPENRVCFDSDEIIDMNLYNVYLNQYINRLLNSKSEHNTEKWNSLKIEIIKYGLYNSLLTAIMPTAATAQLLGNNESIEPYTNNMYTRNVMSGEYQIVNKYMVDDLIELGLWNNKIRENIIANRGSIQHIKEIPDDIKLLYRTVWEIKKKPIVKQAADRGRYICQSQSMSLFMNNSNVNDISNIIFYAWNLGLKTGIYYLRTQPSTNPIQFTCMSCSS